MDIFELAAHEIRRRIPALELRENEPMSAHCSFRIGGPASIMVFPSSSEEISILCLTLKELGISPFIMGNGTNLLVSDRPFKKLVIKMSDRISQISIDDSCTISAECGATLARLAVQARNFGLSGLEFAHGIPGTLGGAISMNAGAYGGEMKDVVLETEYIDENLLLKSVHASGHEFSYRHSIFSDSDKIILKSRLKLVPGDRAVIGAKMQELMEKRRLSQPLDKPSAGSTFKRPAGGYAAALIDQAGLKGFCVGGAQVSEKHAGFIINRGGATFDDVIRLMSEIRKRVFSLCGILLEPEVKILADKGDKLWSF